MTELKIHEKIKLIRHEESLSRSKFSELVNIKPRTLEAIENRGNDPRYSYIQSICLAFPEYTSWLLLDEVNIEHGQISPMIKALMIKQRYWDKEYVYDWKNKTHLDEMKKAIKEYQKSTGEKIVVYPTHILEKLGIDANDQS